MKRTITMLSLVFFANAVNSQTSVSDFETFTLSPNSAYGPTLSIPFQTQGAEFQYEYNSTWALWTGGFSYTNIHDSASTGFTNPYGVRAYKGYTNSATYVVGLDESLIKLSSPQSTVNGFYVTNTTYAYKSMASGDLFARKFGDTTGTGSGTTIAQGSFPDFFKLVVKGYKNGVLKNDSVTVFLANFTFSNNTQDYILDTWQYVNTASIGAVDSIQFFMRSSDVGEYGINTPLYFALDNFAISSPSTVGITQNTLFRDLQVYPNPFQDILQMQSLPLPTIVLLKDSQGKVILKKEISESNYSLDLHFLEAGMYFMELGEGDQRVTKKLIKN